MITFTVVKLALHFFPPELIVVSEVNTFVSQFNFSTITVVISQILFRIVTGVHFVLDQINL